MPFPTIAVTGDAVPTDLDGDLEVAVTGQFSEDAPAHLRISFANGASAAREFLVGVVAPFAAFTSDIDDGGRLYVVPDDGDVPGTGFYDDAIPDAPVDGCWRLAERFDHIDRGTLWPAGPGETTTLRYAVLVGPEVSGWPPPGEYRFEGAWGERVPDDEESWEEWGFTLAVRR